MCFSLPLKFAEHVSHYKVVFHVQVMGVRSVNTPLTSMEGPGSFLFIERILRSYPSAGMHCALLQAVTFMGQLAHALEVNTIEMYVSST
jgi:hypothetical protein